MGIDGNMLALNRTVYVVSGESACAGRKNASWPVHAGKGSIVFVRVRAMAPPSEPSSCAMTFGHCRRWTTIEASGETPVAPARGQTTEMRG
jgi:hypothetical protein